MTPAGGREMALILTDKSETDKSSGCNCGNKEALNLDIHLVRHVDLWQYLWTGIMPGPRGPLYFSPLMKDNRPPKSVDHFNCEGSRVQ
jgi:hypothetical protein